jgi:hypothetical protein
MSLWPEWAREYAVVYNKMHPGANVGHIRAFEAGESISFDENSLGFIEILEIAFQL